MLSANASGRALSEIVADIRTVVADTKLPEGYFITLGGQFQAQEEASRLIGLLSIVSLTLMFVVLYSHKPSTAPTSAKGMFTMISAVSTLDL